MSNNNSSSKTDSFDKEYCESLNRLYNENIELTEIRWFFNRAYDWAYETEGLSPDVVLIGTAVPEEIVIASSAKPYWIIGGSLGSTAWSDDLVPRDTDPVSRSVYGYIAFLPYRVYSASVALSLDNALRYSAPGGCEAYVRRG